MVAGLEEISEGVVRIGERVVNHVPARDRDIAMVFQSYALYPHLTVYENIAFGLRLRKAAEGRDRRRVRDAPASSGSRSSSTASRARSPAASASASRWAARSSASPAAYLMDEPLSNLDAKLRVHMRAEIASLQNELGVTTIYVTHDQVEAMTMGDRVAVMRKGELQQVAPPQELYERPVNLFVGGFIGSPAMNLVEATIERRNGSLVALVGSQSLALGEEVLRRAPALESYVGQAVVLGIRPESLEDAASSPTPPETARSRASSSCASRSARRSSRTSRSTPRPR